MQKNVHDASQAFFFTLSGKLNMSLRKMFGTFAMTQCLFFPFYILTNQVLFHVLNHLYCLFLNTAQFTERYSSKIHWCRYVSNAPTQCKKETYTSIPCSHLCCDFWLGFNVILCFVNLCHFVNTSLYPTAHMIFSVQFHHFPVKYLLLHNGHVISTYHNV
jgi:hypothetical protein